MTKRKSIVSKLLLLVVMLTLVSCCFLGSTFARYVSKESGKATLTVAKWDVRNEEGDVDVAFTGLSPAKDVYKNSETPRTHSTGKVKVAALTNGGAVKAEVTFTFDRVAALTYVGSGNFDSIAAGDYKPASEDLVQGLFSIKFYYSKETDSPEAATQEITSATTKVELAAGTGKMYVYAEVIWTTGGSAGDQGAASDQLDTWTGKHVTGVSFNLSYEAVQISETPVQS